jgi:hypothetical protein
VGIVRTVEWKLICSAEEADTRLRKALASLDLNPEGPTGAITGVAKRSIMKNRWAAKVTVNVHPTPAGSVAVCQVDMAGTKHFDLVDELAEVVGEEVLDDGGIREAVARFGKASRLFGRKEIRHVRNLLRSDEVVHELGQGRYRTKQGLVVLTSTRLFFFEKSLGSETVEEFPITSISSMTTHKKPGGESLLVYASGNMAEIKGMMHGQADALTRAYRNVRQAAESVDAAPAKAVGDDNIAQLERLADLCDRGIISSDEFEAKKAELLKRI